MLGPNLYPIFAALPSQYKRHALEVYRRVREADCVDPPVLQAALLHDAGKYDPATRRHVTIAHRVLIVLLKATPPGKRLLKKLARPSPHGLPGNLFYPFHLNQHHAELGARLASQHGASPEVVELIANHHRHDIVGAELTTLRAADEQS
jgi:putative nucleotidyltransferase with HDIG domain